MVDINMSVSLCCTRYFPLDVIKLHDQCNPEKKGLLTNAEGVMVSYPER